MATVFLPQWNLIHTLGLHPFESPLFKPYQLVTHFFMHGGLLHIALNMFVLWMFGAGMENFWGPKKFLFYYIFTALGAATLHLGVLEWELHSAMSSLSEDQIGLVMREGANAMLTNQNFIDPQLANLNYLLNAPTVGASGAVFGILLAFGMTFPNTMLLLFFVFPIKAKYAVVGIIIYELVRGIQNAPGDNVAHFAHLGGALFGYFLVRYWNNNRYRYR